MLPSINRSISRTISDYPSLTAFLPLIKGAAVLIGTPCAYHNPFLLLEIGQISFSSPLSLFGAAHLSLSLSLSMSKSPMTRHKRKRGREGIFFSICPRRHQGYWYSITPIPVAKSVATNESASCLLLVYNESGNTFFGCCRKQILSLILFY